MKHYSRLSLLSVFLLLIFASSALCAQVPADKPVYNYNGVLSSTYSPNQGLPATVTENLPLSYWDNHNGTSHMWFSNSRPNGGIRIDGHVYVSRQINNYDTGSTSGSYVGMTNFTVPQGSSYDLEWISVPPNCQYTFTGYHGLTINHIVPPSFP